MKEILYRNLTSLDHRRRVVSIRQNFQKGNAKIDLFKRCFYIVEEIKKIDDGLRKMLFNSLEEKKQPLIFLKKIIDNKKGKITLNYTLRGRLYVVKDNWLYTIFYRQEITVCYKIML